MQIKLLVEGGTMKPGPALSQQLGPAGINMGQVISKINEATKEFNGLKVPVELDINTATKTFDVKVFSPPVSELLKKQLGIEKGSGEQKKMFAGNASIEDIIAVAKAKFQNMLCKDLKSAVKTVAGTCVSLGILIEDQSAVDIVSQIAEGNFDKEIKQEKTVADAAKKKKLDAKFKEIKEAQEKQKKAEEAAAAAAAAAAQAAATPAAGTAPAAGTTPATAEAKPEKTTPEKK